MATSRFRFRSAGRANSRRPRSPLCQLPRSIPRSSSGAEARRRTRTGDRQAAAAQARAASRRRAAITPADLMTRLYIFADDSMMGREVGTPYHLKATAYIEREARRLGSLPAGDSGTYFQNLPVFDHSAVSPRRRSRSTGSPSRRAPTSSRATTRCSAEPCAPSTARRSSSAARSRCPWTRRNSWRPRPPTGKFVVMAVANGPDGKPLIAGYRQPLTGYYLKSAGGRRRRARGLRRRTNARRCSSPRRDSTTRRPTAGAGHAAGLLVRHAGDGRGARSARRSTVSSAGRPGERSTARSSFDSTRAPARNVVAILPGSDPKLKGEYVAIGAHNDHVGFNHTPVDHDSLRAFNAVVRPQGEDDRDRPATAEEHDEDSADSRQPSQDAPAASRLDLQRRRRRRLGHGRRCSRSPKRSRSGTTKPKRSLLFVWHAGEEKGLWGSRVLHRPSDRSARLDRRAAQHGHDRPRRRRTTIKGGGPGYLQLIGSRRLSTELGDLVEAVDKTEPTPVQVRLPVRRERASAAVLLPERPLRVRAVRDSDHVLLDRRPPRLPPGDRRAAVHRLRPAGPRRDPRARRRATGGEPRPPARGRPAQAESEGAVCTVTGPRV